MKIYLASGFFNKEQNTTVTFWEKLFSELNLDYYSPRSESFSFSSAHDLEIISDRVDQGGSKSKQKEKVTVDLTGSSTYNVEMKKSVVKTIFKNNLRRMSECTHIYANLQNEDVGTAFEIGHFLGELGIVEVFDCYNRIEILEKCLNKWKVIELVSKKVIKERLESEKHFLKSLLTNLKDRVSVFNDKDNVLEEFILNLNSLKSRMDIENNPSLKEFVDNLDPISKSKLVNLNLIDSSIKLLDESSALDVFLVNSTNPLEDLLSISFYNELRNINLICIDDRPVYDMILLGVLHKIGAPIITYSKEGYGLNVMLSSSSMHFNSEDSLKEFLSKHLQQDISISKIMLGDFDFSRDMD